MIFYDFLAMFRSFDADACKREFESIQPFMITYWTHTRRFFTSPVLDEEDTDSSSGGGSGSDHDDSGDRGEERRETIEEKEVNPEKEEQSAVVTQATANLVAP